MHPARPPVAHAALPVLSPLPHPLLRRSTATRWRLRAAPAPPRSSLAPASPPAHATLPPLHSGEAEAGSSALYCSAGAPPRPHGAAQDGFVAHVAIEQAKQHEWRGLRAWRARGVDLRLRWGPPDGPQAPALLPPAEAPTLAAAVLLAGARGPPASLVEAGLLVMASPCPRGKAALTHAAWGEYLAGRLPLRAGGGPGAGVEAGEEERGEGERRGALLQQRMPQQQREQDLQQQQHPHSHQQPPPPPPQQQEQPQPQQGLQEEPEQQPRGGPHSRLPSHPARPERPRLVRPKDIPGHESSPLGLNGHVLHNLAHIELNAIDLAWDTVVRFSDLGLPDQFYEDFARVADDESRHLGWCLQRLGELGHSYGDMDAHDLLWRGCSLSGVDVAARLAVVPMSQEARGLDAGARMAQRLVGWGDTRSAAVVALIAAEERAHVAVGVTWFARTCAALGLPAGPLYREWLLHLSPELLKGPFNHPERSLVGLPRDWYDPGAAPGPAGPSCGAAGSSPGAAGSTPAAAGSGSAGATGSSSGTAGSGSGATATSPAARGPARGPQRPAAPSGPLPALSGTQLALLARRLAAFADAESEAAAR